MSKPVILDLFSGAGGCAKGYQLAGFYVVGVDLNPQPHYCGDEFYQDDALMVLDLLLAGGIWHGYRLQDVAALHASPPCQGYSRSLGIARIHGVKEHLLLIGAVRRRLEASGKPWVIENVEGSDLPDALELCVLITDTRVLAAQSEDAMLWRLTTRADPHGAALADRHYSRKTPGAAQFTPPGRCIVLITEACNALWVSSWPYAEYVKHAWRGAWLCSLFRNESQVLSSRLITQAVAATRWQWGEPPVLGMVTFVDTAQIRHKRDPGRCFRKAGWKQVGLTKGSFVVLQLLPQDMSPALPASGTQLSLFRAEMEGLRCHE